MPRLSSAFVQLASLAAAFAAIASLGTLQGGAVGPGSTASSGGGTYLALLAGVVSLGALLRFASRDSIASRVRP
jgi:hypothetical protein